MTKIENGVYVDDITYQVAEKQITGVEFNFRGAPGGKCSPVSVRFVPPNGK